ncbi:MAG: putative toxin-antitoxin system toxin component, PIN family [Burkholderiales bacterium]|jgi:putative PIN family toxin of toxin-antitoxin system
MRLVLDSNVWLDWLHFDDPQVIPLRQASENGRVEIVIDAPCRDELVRVLAYDRFGLDTTAQSAMLARVNRISVFLADLAYPCAGELPWCSDPDDVKFLALAEASNADWLVSKDNALLNRRRRGNREPVRFKTGTPQQWALSLSQTTNC